MNKKRPKKCEKEKRNENTTSIKVRRRRRKKKKVLLCCVWQATIDLLSKSLNSLHCVQSENATPYIIPCIALQLAIDYLGDIIMQKCSHALPYE